MIKGPAGLPPPGLRPRLCLPITAHFPVPSAGPGPCPRCRPPLHGALQQPTPGAPRDGLTLPGPKEEEEEIPSARQAPLHLLGHDCPGDPGSTFPQAEAGPGERVPRSPSHSLVGPFPRPVPHLLPGSGSDLHPHLALPAVPVGPVPTWAPRERAEVLRQDPSR